LKLLMLSLKVVLKRQRREHQTL